MQRSFILRRSLRETGSKRKSKHNFEEEVQQELKKLDSNFTNEIQFIKNQIEVVCYKFSEAQKRFDKAEKEYMEAKVELFIQSEEKEKLSDKLQTLIQKNEFEKAVKISQFIGKFEIKSKNEQLV